VNHHEHGKLGQSTREETWCVCERDHIIHENGKERSLYLFII